MIIRLGITRFNFGLRHVLPSVKWLVQLLIPLFLLYTDASKAKDSKLLLHNYDLLVPQSTDRWLCIVDKKRHLCITMGTIRITNAHSQRTRDNIL